MRRSGLLVVTAMVCALSAPAASAAPPPFGGLIQLAPPDACLANAALGGCTDTSGFNFLTDMAMTSDGSDLYVANQLGSIRGYRRDAATGALTFNNSADDGSEQSYGVAVDAAGAFVLQAASDPGAQARVAGFSRGADGTLGAKQSCVVETVLVGCTEVDGIEGVRQIAVAPSGPGIYAAGSEGGGDGADGGTDGDGALVTLKRNAGSGALTQADCLPATDSPLVGDACASGASVATVPLDGVTAVTVSPDGRHVYAGGFSGLAGFNRSTTTGDLAGAIACLRRFSGVFSCPAEPKIAITEDIAISPDGTSLYTAAGGRIVQFSRQPISGALAFVECIAATAGECTAGAPGLGSSVEGIAVSPDNQTVYVTSRLGDNVRAFRRDLATGKLTQIHCLAFTVIAGCGAGAGLKGPRAVFPSPDGRHVYVGSYDGTGDGDRGAIAEFSASLAPTCSGAAVSVAAGGSVALPLTCSDLNGDALTRTITATPASGGLGAIDQAAGSVLYTATPATSGVQSVTFSASDGTNGSVPATVTIDVTPAPGIKGPPTEIAAPRAPRSKIASIAKRVKAAKLKRFTGTASGSLRRVELSLVRLQGGAKIAVARCQALGSKGTLRGLKPSRGRCKASGYLSAKGTTRWTFTLKRKLPAGTYVVSSRAVSTTGAKETVFSTARGNRRTFAVR